MRSPDRGTVHIVGAGLAGLAAAVELAGASQRIVIHEAMRRAGGRCRSYSDAATGMTIDNGTHLVLAGNRSVLSYVRTIGAEAELHAPTEAQFPFVDLADARRWILRLGTARLPWWIFSRRRRVPDTKPRDYLELARLLAFSTDRPIGTLLDGGSRLYQRLLRPFLLAVLNIDPREGSAALARTVMRETLMQGGRACRPFLARGAIGDALVEPALRYLKARGVSVFFGDELVGFDAHDGMLARLDFTAGPLHLSAHDSVILAVPAYVAGSVVPGLRVPVLFRGIVNAHFRIDPPAGVPPMLGVLNGTSEWIFAHAGRMSATISDAGRLFDLPRQRLAEMIWHDVSRIHGLPETLPPWQIVRERRATFAATPEQNALRPDAVTPWRNLFLAGDWTATGLPATLEGAIRSGRRAARLAAARVRAMP